MSQLSSSVSLPQIAHRGVPVVTTETLAQAYEVDAVSIRKNFSCNKARFTEGKHYYTLSGNDLREFKNRVTESNSVQIGKNSRSLTLWTERGAARHAKMLNSDRAWDMFELLEETFFRIARPEPAPAPSPISKRTDPERKALTAIINTWVGMAPIHYASARAQVNAHFGVTSVDALTVAQVKEAIQWVQDKELGITEGIWVHVPGKKTSRHTHQLMNGKKFVITEGLYDSDVKRKVLCGELPGCQCTYRAVIPEFGD